MGPKKGVQQANAPSTLTSVFGKPCEAPVEVDGSPQLGNSLRVVPHARAPLGHLNRPFCS